MPLFWYLSVMEQSKERIPIIGMEAFNYTAAKAGNMLYTILKENSLSEMSINTTFLY